MGISVNTATNDQNNSISMGSQHGDNTLSLGGVGGNMGGGLESHTDGKLDLSVPVSALGLMNLNQIGMARVQA